MSFSAVLTALVNDLKKSPFWVNYHFNRQSVFPSSAVGTDWTHFFISSVPDTCTHAHVLTDFLRSVRGENELKVDLRGH